MKATLSTLVLAAQFLLTAAGCNGSWRNPTPDARTSAPPPIFPNDDGAAHADVPHVPPLDAAPDAALDHPSADAARDTTVADGGSDAVDAPEEAAVDTAELDQSPEGGQEAADGFADVAHAVLP